MNPLKAKPECYINIGFVPRSTHSISLTKTNELKPCRKIISIYSHCTLCAECGPFYVVTAGTVTTGF